MPWLYDTKTGEVAFQNTAEADLQEATNLFGPAIGQGEVVNLGIPDSDTLAQAITAAQAYAKAHPGSATPTANSSTTGDATAEQDIPGASDVVAVTSFLGDLTSANLWVRVAKVIIGGVLIIVGAANLVGADKVVHKAAKAAPLLAA